MDQMIQSFIGFLINLYIILIFTRMFINTSERFDLFFGLVYKATDPVVLPFGSALRTRNFNLAPLLVMVVLLIIKGMVLRSIPGAIQGFANTLFQLYILIIIIMSGFREYYTNPIASFGQRLVNPIRALVANFSQNLTTVNILSSVLLVIVHSIATLIIGQFHTQPDAAWRIMGHIPPYQVHLAIVGSLNLILNLTTFFVYAVLFNALLSWVSPDPGNPVVQLVALISAPIVEPIRRIVPPLAGVLDLSAMIAIFGLLIAHQFGLQILSIFV